MVRGTEGEGDRVDAVYLSRSSPLPTSSGHERACAPRSSHYINVVHPGWAPTITLRFSWHETKAASNWRKHHVSFETAARVFADPFAFSEQDRIDNGEYRWQTIGAIEGVLVLLVAHTTDDNDNRTEIIHIISARAATRSERRRYEQEKYRASRF
jgi:uncharacterized DUF497 family protein